MKKTVLRLLLSFFGFCIILLSLSLHSKMPEKLSGILTLAGCFLFGVGISLILTDHYQK